MENVTKVMIENGRLLWPHLYEPQKQKNGDPKYKAVIAWDKDEKKTTKKVKAAIAAAEEAFPVKYPGKKLSKKYESPLKDGDDEDAPEVLEGMWYLNVSASAKRQPQIFDKKGRDVTDAEKEILYSGCFVHMSINASPFSVDTNSGVGVYVNGTMFAGDGEPVGGGGNVAADFAKFSLGGRDDDDDDEEEDDDDEPRKKSKKKPLAKSKKSRKDDDDDDEEDDDEEDEKPKSKKKPAAKPASKGKSKKIQDDDDDEEEDDDDEEDEPVKKKKPAAKPKPKAKSKAREYDDDEEEDDDDEEEEEDPKPRKKGKK